MPLYLQKLVCSLLFLTPENTLFLMHYKSLQDGQTTSKVGPPDGDSSKNTEKAYGNGNITPRSASLSSSQLLQRKLFAETQVGKASFQKLMEPSSSQKPGIAPYRIVLGDVKEKVSSLFLKH